MIGRRFVIPLTALLLAFAPFSLAASAPEPVRNVIDVGGKQIPLPDGEWRVVGQAGSPPGAWTSLALFRLEGEIVTGVALVQTAAAGASPAWGKAPGCERADLPLARVRYASDHDGSCAWAATVREAGNGVDGAAALDSAWLAALAEAGRNRWRVPSSWGVAGVRVTDPRDAVQVRYAFPALDRPAEAPDAAWVESAWDQVELGFRRRLDASSPLPDWFGRTPVEPVGGPHAVTDDADRSFGRAIWKTVTFRTIVTTLDFTSNYVALGSMASAAALSAFAFVVGPFVYLGHEMAWSYFGEVPAVDLPGIGAEGPG